VLFINRIRDGYGTKGQPIFIGGQIGPRGDAYAPEEALSPAESERFHTPQLDALAEGQVDFLYASTLPALSEARGMVKAMARLGLPYILSFVIRKDGTILDGTPLVKVIEILDNSTPNTPTGYAVNCVHPAVFSEGMAILEEQNSSFTKRILSFQANTSAKDPKDLDGSIELETEKPEIISALMVNAHHRFHTMFMGGCCGTDASHIEFLARGYTSSMQQPIAPPL
jgi:homocysteine S-methyltransferase